MKRLKVLSLAALVAFAACDEGSEPTPPPVITGTISGVVTIEGASRSGVTVTLSSGATATTDGSGAYSFAGVNAGAYTVTISGFPTDATFSSTTKAATITTAAQVVTVNFDGAYVRTSAISGAITAGGKGLAGVKVSIGSSSVNTGANGIYGFSGLRAGSYTVTISGFDAGQYSFASTTATVTVGVGETKVADFTGQLLATASISGKVTIDGTAAAGVTATLSTGAVATTDAAGAYAFTNLTAGNYTVTISGYPADAQFSSVAKPVVITSAGSTVTADFSGAFVKTSVISGTVTVGAMGLGGVKVTLSNGTTVNTDTNGQYSFATLRAGTYTVTISDWDATQYAFATTTASVTVATGESKVANFGGAYLATAKIMGKLYIDELPKNDVMDSSEAVYPATGVTITIEGGAVNNTQSMTTTNGAYEFTGLVAGTYRVTITAPAAGTFGYGGASTSFIVVVPVGGTGTVNFPFDILRQYVTSHAFLGKDAQVATPAGVATGVRPQQGVIVDIYDTYANATGAVPAPVAGVTAGYLGTATTNAAGSASFSFLRTADKSPAGATDNIVFAVYRPGQVVPNRVLNGETVVEIKYNAQDTLVMAPDTFDVLNSGIIVRFASKDGAGNNLTTWTYDVWDRSIGDTTLVAGSSIAGLTTSGAAVPTLPAGYGRMVIAAINTAAPTINAAALAGPLATNAFAGTDTLYVRFTEAALNNGLTYKQTAAITTDVARTIGSHLAIVLNGTQPDSITLAGTQTVNYTQGRVVLRAHREQDDVVRLTAGDPAPAAADPVLFYVYNVNADGSRGAVIATSNGVAPAGAGGEHTTAILTAPGTYLVVAQPGAPTTTIISDTAYTVLLSGKQQADTAKGFNVNGATSALYSSFAWKSNNNQITGVMTDLSNTVAALAGSPAAGLKVWVKTAPTFIGPSKDTVVTVTAAGGAPCPAATGAYCTFANLLEGPYTVQALDGATTATWQFKTTLTTASAPVASGVDGDGVATAVNNTNASTGSRHIQGTGQVAVANFRVTRMDTQIQGSILNDRDLDTNTIDGGEALTGATVDLIRDLDADGIIDAGESVVATTTSGADGSYEFTALEQGNYIVRATSTTAHVTRALSGAGVHTNTLAVLTSAVAAAASPADGANNTRRVGTKTPASNAAMPNWNYATDAANLTSTTHFTFLAKAVGEVKGTVFKGAALPGVAQAGVTVVLTRCITAGTNPSPPVPAALCAKIPGTQRNAVTLADGSYSFTGLDEGVYAVEVVPSSVGLAAIVEPGTTILPAFPQYRATITLGASATDIETVPVFLIN